MCKFENIWLLKYFNDFVGKSFCIHGKKSVLRYNIDCHLPWHDAGNWL
jgi:hypothetical protein